MQWQYPSKSGSAICALNSSHIHLFSGFLPTLQGQNPPLAFNPSFTVSTISLSSFNLIFAIFFNSFRFIFSSICKLLSSFNGYYSFSSIFTLRSTTDLPRHANALFEKLSSSIESSTAESRRSTLSLAKKGKGVSLIYLLCGHTSWQTSHPQAVLCRLISAFSPSVSSPFF